MSEASLWDLALWDWAVKAYGAPGVADICLTLQDNHDQCVPLLLWAAWSAQRGGPQEMQDAADVARAWHEHAITPLRSVRRRLKGPVSDMETQARLAFREKIKALELEAERQALIALETIELKGGTPADPLQCLCMAARAWGEKIPRPTLSLLVEALSAGGFLSYDPSR